MPIVHKVLLLRKITSASLQDIMELAPNVTAKTNKKFFSY
jgi:hypothetical protein